MLEALIHFPTVEEAEAAVDVIFVVPDWGTRITELRVTDSTLVLRATAPTAFDALCAIALRDVVDCYATRSALTAPL